MKIASGSAIVFYDPFRKQIPNFFAILRLVSGEDMVEAAVFTDDHDDVLDGRAGIVFPLIGLWSGAGQGSADCELKQRDGRKANAQGMKRSGCNSLAGHSPSYFSF